MKIKKLVSAISERIPIISTVKAYHAQRDKLDSFLGQENVRALYGFGNLPTPNYVSIRSRVMDWNRSVILTTLDMAFSDLLVLGGAYAACQYSEGNHLYGLALLASALIVKEISLRHLKKE